jgi:predicted thioesterase
MIFIDWNDLEVSKRLNDGDVVSVKYESLGNTNTSDFVLELAQHKTWWKGVQVLDNTDAQIGFLEVSDSNKLSKPLEVNAVDIGVGGHIVLWKAKTFGVHTPMYVIADLERVKGKKVTFHWSAD